MEKLSKQQREILILITKEFYTPKQIAIRRQTSIQAVYKTIKKLKDKGLISKGFKRGFKNFDGALKKSSKNGYKNGIRLHAQQFIIRVLYAGRNYERIRGRGNIVKFDDNTVMLHKDKIQVICSPNRDFTADDSVRAFALSMQYWNRFFYSLESRLDILIMKQGTSNIKLVKHHYSSLNNELAKECNEKKERISIYTRDDGKLWFSIDNSFNLNEAETSHKDTAMLDMQDIVAPFFNDLRDTNNLPLPSESWRLLSATIKNVREIGAGVAAITKVISMDYEGKKVDKDVEVFERADYIG